MIENKIQVEEFLKKYKMDFSSVDLDINCSMFAEEMQKGLDGEESSLMMIPTYISIDSEVPVNEPVIVIDAGGTNFRVAVVYFDADRKPVIEDFKMYPMPGTKGELSKDEFFETMAGYLQPILHRSRKIGLCFSYPVEILPNKDGRLLKFSKEVKVRNVNGEMIGENLIKAVKKLGCCEEMSLVLLNDTVATLLGGKALYPDRVFDSYIGFILGTGTNTSYIEKVKNIGKLPQLKNSEGSMLINIESGIYNKAPRGIIDLEFDSSTSNPGSHALEKAMSGAYQGGIILAVVRKASEEGIFSDNFAGRISGEIILGSREIDDFLYYPYGDNILAGCCSSDQDRKCLYLIIDAIIERAAKFAAFNISAVIIKTGKGTNPCAPVCITADGSTFYKSKLFKTKLDYYIKSYTNDKLNLYCEFVRAENCNLIGTAIAGLIG